MAFDPLADRLRQDSTVDFARYPVVVVGNRENSQGAAAAADHSVGSHPQSFPWVETAAPDSDAPQGLALGRESDVPIVLSEVHLLHAHAVPRKHDHLIVHDRKRIHAVQDGKCLKNRLYRISVPPLSDYSEEDFSVGVGARAPESVRAGRGSCKSPR